MQRVSTFSTVSTVATVSTVSSVSTVSTVYTVSTVSTSETSASSGRFSSIFLDVLVPAHALNIHALVLDILVFDDVRALAPGVHALVPEVNIST